MEQPKYDPPIAIQQTETFSGKDIIIAILFVLVVMSFFGIHLLAYTDDILRYITEVFRPFLGALGYSTGTIINTTTDIAADTTKVGIDIAEGSIKNIGNLFIKASDHDIDLDHTIDKPKPNRIEEPEHDSTANPIQNPISKGKGGWCLIGEVSDRRGCISVSDHAKCMSGQVFPTQKMCLNPTFSPPDK